MKGSWTGGQYSLYRILFGSYLFVHFIHLLPWGAETFSRQGMLADADLSPLFSLFPSVLVLTDSPLMVQALILSAALASVSFALGARDKLAAIWIWYVLACLFTRNPLIANPALPYVGWALLAHLLIPGKPYGSLAAVGRTDPAGDWFMPRPVMTAAATVLALSYSYSGYTKLLSPSWVAGDTLSIVLDNPLARDWLLRDLFMMLPASLLSATTWFILYVELLYAPLALIPRLRPWLWAGMLVVQFGFLFLLNFPDLTVAMLLFHMLAFNPAWFRRKQQQPETIYYDGQCGLCHRVIRFVVAEDHRHQFRFAPLFSDVFNQRVAASVRNELPDSFVLQKHNGEVLLRSDAVIHILKSLGGLWWTGAILLQLTPRPIRDGGYNLIGRFRRRLFPTPEQACPIMSPEQRTRFISDRDQEVAA